MRTPMNPKTIIKIVFFKITCLKKIALRMTTTNGCKKAIAVASARGTN